jgi:UDP-N-acetylglucosamine--N-acetylmuramyl-(pentapeptide) pyrophosphoryl-undecaprenol N-acetylglucosamine transferase
LKGGSGASKPRLFRGGFCGYRVFPDKIKPFKPIKHKPHPTRFVTDRPIRLLIAASGTGGHLFPALAVAERLLDYQIEWLGVPNRLEVSLVPDDYPLHPIPVEGFQSGLSWKTFQVAFGLLKAIFQVKKLLKEKQFDLVFTTGGYIASPAIIAARWQGIPAVLHESNFIPGKVTRWFASWCEVVALGFAGTADYLKKARTAYVNTPVRKQFLQPQPLDLPIPADVPVIIVVGGSQGAVAINQLVRQVAPVWFELGAMVVHLTGERDPDALSLQHPQYISLPFYENMAGLFQRADLAISRAGSGTLTELAVTATPAILIPFPFAAEDHQTYNARVFGAAGAAIVDRQSELTASLLESQVTELLQSPAKLQQMKQKMTELAILDSAELVADILRQCLKSRSV